ncbi:MAG: glycosyltransferase [Candidatus Levyibacteriota bacterium]|nr:MAG: glycosyltransferase [Candidatus Levybacteria bacterium]
MISVVIPFFNEEASLLVLYQEIMKYLPQLDQEYEIIFVDDGSKDGSLEVAKKIAQRNKNVRLFSFRKNYGKAEALTLGFEKALGDYLVTIDADLQDKPSEIEKMLNKAKEGWDLVCGWRKNRKDKFIKVIFSRLFNFLVSKMWGLELHDYNCGLKLYTKEVAKNLKLYGGLHRFIPLIAFEQGFRVSEVPVIHERRKYGVSKFGYSKLWKDFPDMLTMLFLTRYSNRPFHLFGIVGGMFLFLGMLILIYLSMVWLQGTSIGRRPLLFLGMLFVLSGFQVLLTGFLADLIISVSKKSHISDENNIQARLKYTNIDK